MVIGDFRNEFTYSAQLGCSLTVQVYLTHETLLFALRGGNEKNQSIILQCEKFLSVEKFCGSVVGLHPETPNAATNYF